MSSFLVQPAGVEVPVNDIDDCVIQSGTWKLSGSSDYLVGSGGKYKGRYLHQIIAERMGFDLSNDIDHIDGKIYNNQRLNLRPATRSQNAANSKSNNKSGFKGITWNKDKQKWQAQIMVDGKTIYLGLYDIAERAHLYYCIAAIKYFGEFARFE